MTKATTVGAINKYVETVARAEEIPLGDAWAKVEQQYQMICFMGAWDNPSTEVMVPDSMPVSGMRMPGVKIYL